MLFPPPIRPSTLAEDQGEIAQPVAVNTSPPERQTVEQVGLGVRRGFARRAQQTVSAA